MSKELTAAESLEIIKRNIEDDPVLEFKNHRKHNLMRNTFRFTVALISLDFLISLMEEEEVMNVYFNPSAPPPGTGIDGISLRYKVYVRYHDRE